MATPPPDWKEVAEATPVFRFVAAAEDPTPRAEWFLSDREAAAVRGEPPRPNRAEKEHPDLLNGLSVYKTRDDEQMEFRGGLVLRVVQFDEPPPGWDDATPIT